jgi:hypothetical protein
MGQAAASVPHRGLFAYRYVSAAAISRVQTAQRPEERDHRELRPHTLRHHTDTASDDAARRYHQHGESRASLVVSRFLVAAALGEAHTACALYPSYLPCTQHAPVVGSAAFALIDITLADPGRPAVFVNIDSFRGYFVLERHGRSYVITSAALD